MTKKITTAFDLEAGNSPDNQVILDSEVHEDAIVTSVLSFRTESTRYSHTFFDAIPDMKLFHKKLGEHIKRLEDGLK